MSKGEAVGVDSYLYEGEERPEVYAFPKKADHISIGIVIRHSVNFLAWNARELILIYLALGLPVSVILWVLSPYQAQGIPDSWGLPLILQLLLDICLKFVPALALGAPVAVGCLMLVRVRLHGEPLSMAQLLSRSLRVLPRFMVPTLIYTLGATVTMILFPLLWLWMILLVYFTVYDAALIVGNQGVLSCFGHSFRLVKGNWFRVVGVLLLSLLMTAPFSVPNFFISGSNLAYFAISALLGISSVIGHVVDGFLYQNLDAVDQRRLRVAAARSK